MDRQSALDLICQKEEKLCVIATVASNGLPECAVVGYAAREDGTIVINTNRHTRKIANLRENNRVAIVIGWSFGDQNVQYEGVAEIVERDNPRFSSLEDFFFTTNPSARKFKSPDTVFIHIKPTWIKVIDLRDEPRTEEFIIA
jgi:general stress protein 26